MTPKQVGTRGGGQEIKVNRKRKAEDIEEKKGHLSCVRVHLEKLRRHTHPERPPTRAGEVDPPSCERHDEPCWCVRCRVSAKRSTGLVALAQKKTRSVVLRRQVLWTLVR